MTAVASNFSNPHFGNIPLACVIPSKTNPRKHFNEADLAELAESIKNHGLAQPILVRPLPTSEDMIDCVEIVAGERRYRASKLAGLESIPAIVRELTDVQALELQIIENLQRKDVHEIEEAEGYDQLMKQHGYTADKLADKVGKSRSYIYGRLKFCALSPSVREAFFDGKLSASTALLIARIPVESLQDQATEEIVNDGDPMSYRSAFEHIQLRYMLTLDRARFPIKDARLVADAGSCDACPKRTGNQPMVFKDVAADVCTDPNCFASKCRAHDNKVLAVAEKKGTPVYEGEEAKQFKKDTELVPADIPVWRFDRIADHTIEYKKAEDVLTQEQLPKPAAFVRIDGKVQAMYEETAMQAALEKACICESQEAHDARLEAERDQVAEAEEEAKQQASKAARERRERLAEDETAARIAAYRKVRETMQHGLSLEAWRLIAKELLLGDYYVSVPANELPEIYTWTGADEDALIAYVESATVGQLQLMLMDMVFGESLAIKAWALDEDDKVNLQDEKHQSFAALCDAATVDIDAVRSSLQQASEDKVSKPKKAKSKDSAKAAGIVPAPNVAWPFPTGTRGE
ncbi:ParB/RepB/Spo0J family partition protein [Noviherbaspirillum cavernae]|uniref:ParB/RepB/Spo0J family partition protein n=1 Tax=Noviherbaspirillum cavernae TaxID=2320862 RepID=A0A418X1D9_9BURK|nr:ParB/RepB/Spo0J family partition protein [Noviherbaspirillum cavernae]RJG06272.1 ParB/RepB/Spo0J family partition protein [Noviherbaspirillum cavernae]